MDFSDGRVITAAFENLISSCEEIVSGHEISQNRMSLERKFDPVYIYIYNIFYLLYDLRSNHKEKRTYIYQYIVYQYICYKLRKTR